MIWSSIVKGREEAWEREESRGTGLGGNIAQHPGSVIRRLECVFSNILHRYLIPLLKCLKTILIPWIKQS